MTSVSIKNLASDVATLLGESLALECHPQESPFPDIEDRVRILVRGTLANLIAEAKPEELSDGNPLMANPVTDSQGMVTITLPEDFHRLVCVKMSDWSRAVTEVSPGGTPLSNRQSSRWNAIRGTPQRPVAVMDFNSAGRILKLYSSGKDAKLETGVYIPRPEISSGDTIEIPGAIYHALLSKLLTALISDT